MSLISKHRLLFVRLAIAAIIVSIVLSQCQGSIKCCAYIAVSLLLSMEFFIVRFYHPTQSSNKPVAVVPQKRKTNINDCLRSAVNAIQGLFANKVMIQAEYRDLPLIPSYPDMLIKVFFTVLENAIQKIEGIGNISIQTSNAINNIVIQISTAPGHNISDSFDKKPGTATINLVRSVLHDHGGTIEVNRYPGNSIRYTIMLPANNN